MKSATETAVENIKLKNDRMSKYANRKRKHYPFSIDDFVWLSTANLKLEDGTSTRKLHPKFCGPFQIVKEITPVSFKLKISNPMRARGIHDTFHVNLLKPFVSDTFDRDPEPAPAIHLAENNTEWEVEKILSDKLKRGKRYYLVKWKGYPDHENTWEPEKHLSNAQDLLQDYIASRRR